MMKMTCSSSSSSPLLLLLLFCLSASFSCSSAAPRDSKLRLLLHRSPLMASKQDVSRASLAELLLSDLLQVENEAMEDDSLPVTEGEPEDVRVDLERAAGSGPLLAPRERKAGCKNFFWKTFTSC